jgi:hypothetical protein
MAFGNLVDTFQTAFSASLESHSLNVKDLSSVIILAVGAALPKLTSSSQDDLSNGWAYYGSRSGSNWNQRFFSINGRRVDDIPRVGEVVTAIGNVNVRQGTIEYDQASNSWKNKPKIGILHVGDTTTVQSVMEVSEGFWWIGVRSYNKTHE